MKYDVTNIISGHIKNIFEINPSIKNVSEKKYVSMKNMISIKIKSSSSVMASPGRRQTPTPAPGG